MFIGEKLIYLELQKTGSTYISNYFKKNIGGEINGKHNWLTLIPSDKKIAGSIRNPWDWYVSLWAYGCRGKGGLHDRLTNRWLPFRRNLWRFDIGYTLNDLFRPMNKWKQCYTDVESQEKFRRWLKMMFASDRRKDLGENYSDYKLSEFAGFMTHRYCKIFLEGYLSDYAKKFLQDYDSLILYDEEHNILDYTIELEKVDFGLETVLLDLGYNVPEKDKEELNHRNRSDHKESCYYYDEETSSMVSSKERFIIEKYGYKAPLL